ncbi:MAG TPA: hypothetical protein VGK29_25060 [Paludibaculum sp.]|jgi:hypothetical protein
MSPEELTRGEDCLTPADLEALLEGRLPEAQAHVDKCPVCEYELASLREFLAEKASATEQQDLAWIEARLRPAAQPVVRRKWLSWFPSAPLPRFAFTCAAALLVVAGSLQLRHMAGPSLEDNHSVTVRSSQIRILAPSGDLDTAPVEFSWEAVPHAATYEVVLTEVDGTQLWSNRTTSSKLFTPVSIQQQMLPRKSLLWRVRALDGQGVVIAESSPERIRLLPAAER